MENKKFIPALGYNFLSGYYDIVIKLTMPEKKFRGRLIDLLNPQPDDCVLEFGFGTGQNLTLLKKRQTNTEVHGVDIDPEIKAIAEYKLKAQGVKIPLKLYDGSILPFSDDSFDKVFSSLVFHQLDKDEKLRCLKEIYRVLRPDGVLIIGDWGKSKNIWMRITFYLVQLLDGFKTTADNVNGLMPKFISSVGFEDAIEIDFINTRIGTFSYYTAKKSLNS